MLDTKVIKIMKCDICSKEVEDFDKEADWVHTCSRCNKHFCTSCGDNYHGEEILFSLCSICFAECGITNERLK